MLNTLDPNKTYFLEYEDENYKTVRETGIPGAEASERGTAVARRVNRAVSIFEEKAGA